VRLLRTLGAAVWVTGTHRRRGDYHGTMMSPGLPDLLAFLPRRDQAAVLVCIEVKAAGGRLRPGQVLFREACARAQVAHVVGGIDDVVAWLLDQGILAPSQVGAHRMEVTR
jgi:hypothetical protein